MKKYILAFTWSPKNDDDKDNENKEHIKYFVEIQDKYEYILDERPNKAFHYDNVSDAMEMVAYLMKNNILLLDTPDISYSIKVYEVDIKLLDEVNDMLKLANDEYNKNISELNLLVDSVKTITNIKPRFDIVDSPNFDIDVDNIEHDDLDDLDY